MDIILQEFQADIGRLRNLLILVETVGAMPGTTAPAVEETTDEFTSLAASVHAQATQCFADIKVLPGAMIAYLAGRFEHFVKTEFEDLCDRVASGCSAYHMLPEEMKANLVKYTSMIMDSPRRYGYGDKGYEPFLVILSENLKDPMTITRPDPKCLSITTENMRSDILKDLFVRIGYKEIWDRISQQATVMLFFTTSNPVEASREARSLLDEIMRKRNDIAHPSTSLAWPEIPTIRRYLDYFDALSEGISLAVGLFAVAPPRGTPPAGPPTP